MCCCLTWSGHWTSWQLLCCFDSGVELGRFLMTQPLFSPNKQWAGGLWPKIFLLSKNILKVWVARPARAIVVTDGPESFMSPPAPPWPGSMDSECRFEPRCAYFWMFNNKSNKYGKLANKNRVIIPRLNDIPMQKHITLNIKQNLEEGTDFDPYLAHCPFLWVLMVLRPLKLYIFMRECFICVCHCSMLHVIY